MAQRSVRRRGPPWAPHAPLVPCKCQPVPPLRTLPWLPGRGAGGRGGGCGATGPRGRGVRGADGVDGMAATRRARPGPAWAAAVGLLGQAPAAKSRNLFIGLFSSDFSCVPSIQGSGSVAKLLLLVPGQMVENGSFHLRNFALSAAKNGGPR